MVYKHANLNINAVAAFHFYALHGMDAAKKGRLEAVH